MPINRAYGAKPSPFDPRDFRYSRLATPSKRPTSADVSKPGEPIFDQGQLGSCVWNAIAGVLEHGQPGFIASRLFGYYKTRVLQHDVKSDDGCDPRTALEALRKSGVCPEANWPYNPAPADQNPLFAKRPSSRAYAAAHLEVMDQYQRLGATAGVLNDILDCIGVAARPVLLGIAVYESFESNEVANTGKVPLPGVNEQLLGYHEVIGQAYNDTAKMVKCRNSWASDWGERGYFYLPYDYVSNPKLVTDAFTIIHAAHK